jgi:hypothetical protein
MDYYAELKQQGEQRCKAFHKTVTDLRNQLPKVRKRLEAEKGNRGRLEDRLAKLQELSMEKISEQNSYEKYKVSMRRLRAELEASQEIIANIETRTLPDADQKLKTSEMNLRIVLDQLAIENRKRADSEINSLLRQCVNEYDSCLDANTKIYQDYGLTFICRDETFCPGPWKAEEVHGMRVRLGLIPNSEKSFSEVWKEYKKPPPQEPISAEAEEPPFEPTADADALEGDDSPASGDCTTDSDDSRTENFQTDGRVDCTVHVPHLQIISKKD